MPLRTIVHLGRGYPTVLVLLGHTVLHTQTFEVEAMAHRWAFSVERGNILCPLPEWVGVL